MNPQTPNADLAIVGAGAAGLAAALFAAEAAPQPLRILLLDGAKKPGAKILVAGGGRCNVTHHRVTPDDYHGPRPAIRNILRTFTEHQTVHWFQSLGVTLKQEDTGKLFPTTDDAHTVLHALLNRCEQLHIDLKPDHRVTSVAPAACGFAIQTPHNTFTTTRLILATGGRSLPRTGSDGAGYALARSLGHTVTPTHPALVPLILADDFYHAKISGIAHPAELAVFIRGKLAERRAGSLLWTHFGISGPLTLDISRSWVVPHAQGKSPELRLNFLPGETFDSAEKWLLHTAAASPKRTAANVLADRLPARIADQLAPPGPIGQLPRDARRALVHALIETKLPVERDRGWNYAEVTAGGVPLSEVDPRTMESRRVSGLYLIGEILDVEGRIGGFNFQWAWTTAHLAGTAAARSLSP